jgi:DNA-binding LacI/PurR family transcriptional regulator
VANIEDVAKKCGVSIATVSRVFNRRGNVRRETVDRVISAADELDYNPKLTARRNSIALVVENLDFENFGGFNSLLVGVLVREVIKSSYHVEILEPYELGLLREKFVCGVVSILYTPRLISMLKQVRTRGVPLVTINSVVPNTPAVISNEPQGVGLAMKHLVDLGHRRIGLRSGGKRNFSSDGREAAFETWRSELGLRAGECVIEASRSNRPEHLITLLESDPTAVMVCGEFAAMSASHNLWRLGRRIPDDLSLVTYEHPGISKYCVPSHTTIGQNVEELARQAMTMVKEMESGRLARDEERHVEVDYKLRVRASTAPPREAG